MTFFRLAISVLVALLASAVLGCISLGVFRGFPDKIVPTIQFYFPVVSVLTLIVGSLLFALLRFLRIPLSLAIAVGLGALVACLPLSVLIGVEVLRPGPMAESLLKDVLSYATAVLASGAIGGGTFFLVATLLRVRDLPLLKVPQQRHP